LYGRSNGVIRKQIRFAMVRRQRGEGERRRRALCAVCACVVCCVVRVRFSKFDALRFLSDLMSFSPTHLPLPFPRLSPPSVHPHCPPPLPSTPFNSSRRALSSVGSGGG
jgi:hypothetical protein